MLRKLIFISGGKNAQEIPLRGFLPLNPEIKRIAKKMYFEYSFPFFHGTSASSVSS